MLNILYKWLVTGGTSGKGVILREKRSQKYGIKIFRLRLCFWENRLWIFARYAVHFIASRTHTCVQSARRTVRKFRVDFLENKASNENFLFYIFAFFFHVESPPFRLYYQLPTTLYNYSNINSKCKFSVPIPLFRLLRFKILNKYILLRSKKKPNSRFLIKVSKV